MQHIAPKGDFQTLEIENLIKQHVFGFEAFCAAAVLDEFQCTPQDID